MKFKIWDRELCKFVDENEDIASGLAITLDGEVATNTDYGLELIEQERFLVVDERLVPVISDILKDIMEWNLYLVENDEELRKTIKESKGRITALTLKGGGDPYSSFYYQLGAKTGHLNVIHYLTQNYKKLNDETP